MTDTYEWAGGSAPFDTRKKWSLSTDHKIHAVPGASDIADFDKRGVISGDGSVYQVTIEATVTFDGEITATDADGGMVVSGNMTVGKTGSLDASDIISGDSKLTFKAGSTIDAGGGTNGIPAGAIGLSAGGGTVNFDGDTFTSSGLIAIGNSVNGVTNSGVATATAKDGAKVEASYTGLGGTGGYSSTENNTGTLILTGANTAWSNDATSGQGAVGSILVGVVGKGVLKIEHGASMSDATYGDIASSSTATGTVTVTGAGSVWTNQEGVYVGDAGKGTLTIEHDGSVTSGAGDIGNQAGSVGVATIESGGSWDDTLWLAIGDSGKGTLRIKDAGTMSVGQDLDLSESSALYLGDTAGSSGALSVVGDDSQLSVNGQALVGLDGHGTLSVSDGATMSTGDASGNTPGGLVVTLDSDGSGAVTVTGDGSSLTNNGVLGVGAGAKGSLTISDGGEVTTNINQSLGYQGLYAGGDQGAAGVITVTGAGSKLTIDTYAVIGSSGAGTLDVDAGGYVSIGALLNLDDYAGLLIGDGQGSSGTVDADDATLAVRGQVDVGVYGKGTLKVTDGGSITTGDSSGETSSGFAVGDFSGSKGTVSVTGAHSELVNEGTFVVGSQGHGSLDVSEGGTVETNLSSSYTYDGADIGLSSGSVGTVTVQSTGSLFSVGTNLVVGQAGRGTLVDTDNAAVEVAGPMIVGELSKSNGSVAVQGGALLTIGGETSIGDQTGSTGLVTISGVATIDGADVQSQFDYGAQLVVGYEGKGAFTVDEGALATNTGTGEIDVGLGKGGDGTLTVDGSGSELEGTSFTLGGLGKATVAISDGGLVAVTGQALVQKHADVTLSGGTLEALNVTFKQGGTLSGYGAIDAPTIDGGAITDTGGTLVLDGAVGGKATLTVDQGYDMEFEAGVGKLAQLLFGAGGDQMSFAAPQSMAGEFESFGSGDAIDLIGVTVDKHSFRQNSGFATLKLTLSDGDSAKLDFAGTYTKQDFQFGGDGANGTLIKFV
jgi:fibronectin-binding autotransporter adhesin